MISTDTDTNSKISLWHIRSRIVCYLYVNCECAYSISWFGILAGQFGYPNAIPDTPNSSNLSMSGQNMIEMVLRLPQGYSNYLEKATRTVGVQTGGKCVYLYVSLYLPIFLSACVCMTYMHVHLQSCVYQIFSDT